MPRESTPLISRFGLASRWLLAAIVVSSALAVGTVYASTLCWVAGALAIAAVLAWYGAQPFRARPSATLLLAVGVGLTLFTALQLLPLPVALLAKIAPANADIWARCLEPLGLPGPSWAPITVDPIATRIEVLKALTYVAAFLVALRVSHRREGVVFVECTLVASGMLVAIAAILHPAFNAQRLFGVYKPVYEFGRHIAPLLNPNHLAGYLNIAFCVALSMGLTPRERVPRVVALACAAVLLGTQLWIASRGGVLAMGVGGALVLWSTRSAAEGSRGAARIGALMPAFVTVAGIAMGVLAASQDAWNELAETNVSKLRLTRDALGLVPSFPLFGSGRGTFESVFPAFRTDSQYISYSHPENIVAQWAVEWGVLVTIAAALAIGFALRPSAQSRPKMFGGAWAAIVATAIHNLADFSSELPAVGIAVAVCAAIVVSGPSSDRGRRAPRWAARPRAVAAFAAGGLVAALGMVIPHLDEELFEDRLAYSERVLKAMPTRDELRAIASAAMLRHPGEAFFPYGGATWALRTRTESVLPWVGRTLERFPGHGPAHFVLARWLHHRSPSQARLEYRLALESTGRVHEIVREAMPLLEEQYDVLHFAEAGSATALTLETLSTATRERLPATSQLLDARLIDLKHDALPPRTRAAEAAVRDLEPGTRAPWCETADSDCIAVATEHLQQIRAALPRRCESYVLAARLAIAAGKGVEALGELSAAAELVDDRRECLMALVTLATSVKATVWVDEGLARLGRSGCSEPPDCGNLYLFIANTEDARGNVRRALSFMQKAHEAWPANTDLLSVIARKASALGMHREALDALNQAGRRDGADPALEQLIAREKLSIEQERLRDSIPAP